MHPSCKQVWHWLGPVVCLVIAGCNLQSQVRGRPELARTPEEMHPPVREFLLDGFDEDTPKTFYAYFIIEEDRPGAGEQERRAALAEAFWRGFEFDPRFDQPLTPSVVYWPLANLSLAEAKLALERGQWDLLAENYQHERARLIMQRIRDLAGVGPFFILAFQPLGQAVKPFVWQGGPLLIIDFSVIPEEKFIPVARAVYLRIMGNPRLQDKSWKLDEIRSYFRGLLGSETDNAVWVKN